MVQPNAFGTWNITPDSSINAAYNYWALPYNLAGQLSGLQYSTAADIYRAQLQAQASQQASAMDAQSRAYAANRSYDAAIADANARLMGINQQIQGSMAQAAMGDRNAAARLQAELALRAQIEQNAQRLEVAKLAGSGGLMDAMAARYASYGMGAVPAFGGSFLAGGLQNINAPTVSAMGMDEAMSYVPAQQQIRGTAGSGGNFGGGGGSIGGGFQMPNFNDIYNSTYQNIYSNAQPVIVPTQGGGGGSGGPITYGGSFNPVLQAGVYSPRAERPDTLYLQTAPGYAHGGTIYPGMGVGWQGAPRRREPRWTPTIGAERAAEQAAQPQQVGREGRGYRPGRATQGRVPYSQRGSIYQGGSGSGAWRPPQLGITGMTPEELRPLINDPTTRGINVNGGGSPTGTSGTSGITYQGAVGMLRTAFQNAGVTGVLNVGRDLIDNWGFDPNALRQAYQDAGYGGGMAQGGTLRPGEGALVGEGQNLEGLRQGNAEVVRMNRDNSVDIIPLRGPGMADGGTFNQGPTMGIDPRRDIYNLFSRSLRRGGANTVQRRANPAAQATPPPTSTPAQPLADMNNLPVFQMARGNMPIRSIYNMPTLSRPELGISELPNPFQVAARFRQMDPLAQRDYVEAMQGLFGIRPEQTTNMINMATPGYRAMPRQAVIY